MDEKLDALVRKATVMVLSLSLSGKPKRFLCQQDFVQIECF